MAAASLSSQGNGKPKRGCTGRNSQLTESKGLQERWKQSLRVIESCTRPVFLADDIIFFFLIPQMGDPGKAQSDVSPPSSISFHYGPARLGPSTDMSTFLCGFTLSFALTSQTLKHPVGNIRCRLGQEVISHHQRFSTYFENLGLWVFAKCKFRTLQFFRYPTKDAFSISHTLTLKYWSLTNSKIAKAAMTPAVCGVLFSRP